MKNIGRKMSLLGTVTCVETLHVQVIESSDFDRSIFLVILFHLHVQVHALFKYSKSISSLYSINLARADRDAYGSHGGALYSNTS